MHHWITLRYLKECFEYLAYLVSHFILFIFPLIAVHPSWHILVENPTLYGLEIGQKGTHAFPA